MKLTDDDWSSLKHLRQTLHKHPELSGQEKETPDRILNFLKDQDVYPDEVIKPLGKTGMALIYEGKSEGKTVGFRCDLDALPIREKGDLEYASTRQGVGHLCGHDGHMAMVTALGLIFGRERPASGKVVLLYQPAEETGQGAGWVIRDEKFEALALDYLFGLHNIPGEPLGKVILKEGHFNAASKGMEIALTGATSHAAEPDKGVSPALALAELIFELNKIIQPGDFKDFTLLTIIHAVLGEEAYGTSPGKGVLRATLRAYRDADLGLLSRRAESLVNRITYRHKLRYAIRYVEEFPAVKNEAEAYTQMERAAKSANLEVSHRDSPYNWSEDFGQYRQKTHAGFFGLGSGEDQPKLHHENFNFPDEILPQGVAMYYHLAQNILANG